jgi:hypothetical protein
MENLTVTLESKKLQDAVLKGIESVLSSTYGNPVRDCIEKALKEKDGELKKYVDDIIQQTLNKPEFKEQLGGALLQRMVESAMKK